MEDSDRRTQGQETYAADHEVEGEGVGHRGVTRDDFRALLDRAAAGWASGDVDAVGDCFAEDVEYLDPYRYRFDRRADLLPFFEPPTDGQHVTWHRVLWDDEAQTGVVEYTYVGHHRYHGTAIARVGADGRITRWREWQHLDDALDWEERMRGPDEDGAIPISIDHVQLSMPAGAEAEARRFYGEQLGLPEVTKPPELAGRGGCWFAGPGVAVHLGAEERFRPLAKAHPAFVVRDLDAARAALVAAGIPITEDDTGLPVRRCYVHDPFGNRIELVDARDAGFSQVRARPQDGSEHQGTGGS